MTCLVMPFRQPRAISRHSAAGKTTLSGTSRTATFGNGRSQPPKNSVTQSPLITTIAAYSARKNSDQRKPEYSVWNPATSSDSASGRSKGARFVSAVPAMMNSTVGTSISP